MGSILRSIGLALVLAVGCSAPHDGRYVQDGRQYGVVSGLFRERWWNYYERGTSFAAGGFWDAACDDYREALRQRDRDQRMARTYGMHFIDYFPRRELGVACYRMGRYEEACRALETSLRQVESARAKYYLNQARRELLRQSGAGVSAPEIRLASPADGLVTGRTTVLVAGEVVDAAYASSISVNGEPLFIELAAPSITFQQELRLSQGANRITIRAGNLTGAGAQQTVVVHADFEGPLVHIADVIDGQKTASSRVLLRGTVFDPGGVASVEVNGQRYDYAFEREVTFAHAADLQEGSNIIRLEAVDRAGNSTRGVLRLEHVPEQGPRADMFAPGRPIVLAMRGPGMLDTGYRWQPGRPESPHPHAEPALRLDIRHPAEIRTVYCGELYVDGSATGAHAIARVLLNGEPLRVIPGRTVYFSRLVELQEGENRIIVDAEDSRGNRASESITVVRAVPAARHISARMSLAVMPFERTGAPTALCDSAYEALISAFVAQQRFNIVSRGAELEAVLGELKLSRSGLVDKAGAVQAGRLIAADALLTGTVCERPGSLEIYARIISTETGALFDALDVYAHNPDMAQVRHMTGGLALKFAHSFPLLEGIVLRVSGPSLYADFGGAHNLKRDMQLIVFREGEKIIHPVSGRFLGRDTEELGVATVVNVFESMSLGRLSRRDASSRIQAGDLVVTR